MTWAALAALAWALIAITLAALAPSAGVPRIFHSTHVEHLAAFYLLTIVGALSFPRLGLLRLIAVVGLFAALLAAVRVFEPAHRPFVVVDLLCDVAGIWAATAPMLAMRLRTRRALSDDANRLQ